MYSIGDPIVGRDDLQPLASTFLAEVAAPTRPSNSAIRYCRRTTHPNPGNGRLTAEAPSTGPPDPRTSTWSTTDEGDYFEVDGNTVTAQYRPVQPLVDAEIPDRGRPDRGLPDHRA